MGARLADALAYAHRGGVVHRDVKLSSILLSADERTAKLLDFGVARLGESEDWPRRRRGSWSGYRAT